MHLRQGSATRQGKSSKLASTIDIANAVARAPADAPASATSRLSQAPPLARRNARVLIAWAVPRRWEIQTMRRWIAEGVRTTDGGERQDGRDASQAHHGKARVPQHRRDRALRAPQGGCELSHLGEVGTRRTGDQHRQPWLALAGPARGRGEARVDRPGRGPRSRRRRGCCEARRA